ncbi:YkuS family protein [Vallitalea okinawensis]|uniref:YkuS family protein n=1 Tax=Vallitalea okinawensis TaxID=2078660 RepID=UPI000CFC96CC|nr:YkuS family protein [Vallitalea okinawensis]
MIIGIQSGLEELMAELQSKGYPVKVMDNYINHVDVYIYSSNKVEGLLQQVDCGPTNSYGNCYGDSHGMLMINARGKNVKDIEYIINSRCYSKLDLL